MIKKFIIYCLSLLVLSLGVAGESLAVHASPEISEVVQPDGRVIKVKIKGDEWNHRTETVDGYVVEKAKSGKWHYISSYEGDTPILSDTLAHELPKPAFKRHIRPGHEFRKPNPNTGLTQSPSVDGLNSPSAAPYGIFSGKILFILAEFTDRAGTYSETSFASLLSNNINDYFNKASYGKVTLQPASESYGTSNNGVIGWVNLGYAHPDTGSNTGSKNQKITKDAITAADPYINYASFDTNGDGYVDANELAIVVIVAGYERSYSSSYTPTVWGHKWSISGPPKVDSVFVGADHNGAGGYAQFGEIHRSSSSDAHQATMGIMVHELGHLIFALPDLYDTDYSSEGIGYFSVMAAGSWGKSTSNSYWGETPVLPDAWTKYKLGWVDGTVGSGDTSIVAAGSTPATSSNSVYKLATNSASEYYLIENRQPAGYDRGLELISSSIGGLAIWHIDDSKTSNNAECYPSSNCKNNHYRVALEQADGLWNLEKNNNPGDSGDLFPGSTNNRSFIYSSVPDSRLYSGSASSVSVTSISASGSTMTAILLASSPTTTAYPAGGIYNSTQSVTLLCSDEGGSGCDKIYYTTDGTTPTTASTVYSTAISVTETSTLKFFAKDLAGNSEAVKSAAYIIDTTEPIGTISINSGTAFTRFITAALTISCTDTNGCALMQFSNDNATWTTAETYATNKAWTLTTGDWIKTVYVRFCDSAGNWTTSTISDTIVLDATAPTTTASPAGGIYNSTQGVIISCSDGTGSGCDKIYYTTDGSIPGTSSGVYSGPISISASATLRYYSVDNTGNSEVVNTETYVITTSVLYALNVIKAGSGSGTVISTPDGIDCGEYCSASFTNGDVVSLTAIPSGNALFAGWSGDCGSTTISTSVTMDSGKTCTAIFIVGLLGEYYNNSDLTDPGMARTDPEIDFDWGTGSPDTASYPAIDAESFAVRWTGKLQVDYNETYTFHAVADDGIRLWIDGHLVLDYWLTGGVSLNNTIDLMTGMHDIKMEFFEDTGEALVQLYWSSPSTPYGIIPNDHLYPPDGAGSSPTFEWAGDTGFAADGIEPEIGDSETMFTYRVKYADTDGDPPMAGFPRAHVLKGGVEITGSPFVMSYEGGDYTVGAVYRFSTTLTAGADYTYYFDAVDGTGLQAVSVPVIPTPTAPEDAPDVEDIFIHSILGLVTVSGTGLGEVTMTLGGCASASTDTAADGTYSFSGLADGDCTVTPGLEGYAFTPSGSPVKVAGADVTGIDFTAVLLDSDNDGYSDIDEIATGSDPFNADSTPEVCDGVDNDLNGQADEGVLFTYYLDADGDTYGSATVTTQACERPSGYVSNSMDCNDNNASIKPGAVEADNGLDDNCNRQVDEGIVKKVTAPDIIVSPTTLPFGSVNVDTVSEKTVTVRNEGDADLTITGITNPSSSFNKVSDNCSGKTLSPSSGCTVTIRFSPASAEAFNSSFNIQSNDTDENTVTVSLTGTGASVGSPDIDVSSVDLSFPNISAGVTADQEITISNKGNSPLTISGSTEPSEPFSIIAKEDNCSSHTLAPSQSCKMKVRFTPIGSGTFNSNFNIQSNDPDENPVTVTLGGSVTPGNNNIPTKPNLDKPANGGSAITTTYALKWEISEDMDGDQVTYWLYIGTDPGLAGVDPTIVSTTSNNNNSAKATGYSAGLIGLLGIISLGGLARDKRRIGMFIMTVIFLGGFIFTSCGMVEDDYSDSRDDGKDYVTYTVTNLKPNTTYYWKVVADDGKGGTTESDDYSFTTGW